MYRCSLLHTGLQTAARGFFLSVVAPLHGSKVPCTRTKYRVGEQATWLHPRPRYKRKGLSFESSRELIKQCMQEKCFPSLLFCHLQAPPILSESTPHTLLYVARMTVLSDATTHNFAKQTAEVYNSTKTERASRLGNSSMYCWFLGRPCMFLCFCVFRRFLGL